MKSIQEVWGCESLPFFFAWESCKVERMYLVSLFWTSAFCFPYTFADYLLWGIQHKSSHKTGLLVPNMYKIWLRCVGAFCGVHTYQMQFRIRVVKQLWTESDARIDTGWCYCSTDSSEHACWVLMVSKEHACCSNGLEV